jgi:hypothetical protein
MTGGAAESAMVGRYRNAKSAQAIIAFPVAVDPRSSRASTLASSSTQPIQRLISVIRSGEFP